ncbi:MAG: response regulator [Anaerolineaceae bacterium]|nr:response regulator [Anaerolineaceae bacterium]MBN2678497.1 response regulator [Anaerolineaceae bacterium]
MAEKILIVDDDVDTLRLVGLMLERQGYLIRTANNGAQALVIAKSEHPDLIVLDIMMPDMDGFEVTRKLRAEPSTSGIPIAMFTAKGQLEDKVAGYDAGVDEYLTKPIHPAELNARIKALMTRTSMPKTAPMKSTPATTQSSSIMAVMSARGGLGASTTALNLAVSLFQTHHVNAIAVELHPGQGEWMLELNIRPTDGICNLLRMEPDKITASAVKAELIEIQAGIRILVSNNKVKDVGLLLAIDQMEAVIKTLAGISQAVVVDIGCNLFPGYERILKLFSELVVVTEPHPLTVRKTRLMLDEFKELGFTRDRTVSIVLLHRQRADIQLTWSQVQEELGLTVDQIVSPEPETAYHAAVNHVPLVQMQPDGLAAQQYQKLAEHIMQRIKLDGIPPAAFS